MNKYDYLKKCCAEMEKMFDEINNTDNLFLTTLNQSKTALIVIDMINGFVKKGALSSERILKINDKIALLCKACDFLDIKTIAFADCHNDNSVEFDSYPPHCINGSDECKITDEIMCAGKIDVINKNSTNAFIEHDFANWLTNNQEIDTFIVTGCCTDICVLQFVLTLKTYFTKENKRCRIIVPKSMVETYDSPTHDGDLCNIFSLYNMKLNGIEVVKELL